MYMYPLHIKDSNVENFKIYLMVYYPSLFDNDYRGSSSMFQLLDLLLDGFIPPHRLVELGGASTCHLVS